MYACVSYLILTKLVDITYIIITTHTCSEMCFDCSQCRHCQQLKIAESHNWFQSKVNQWIDLATERCKSGIKKAIELDKVVQVTDDVQFSSSAVDGAGLLFLLMKFSDEVLTFAYSLTLSFSLNC